MREIEFWKFFFLERGKVRQTASLFNTFLNIVTLLNLEIKNHRDDRTMRKASHFDCIGEFSHI